MVIIGIDPHKRSHTAVVVDRSETVVDTIRVEADRHQRRRSLEWATRFEPRTWTVEGATGMGALLAQLVDAGEHVVDVPPKLSARVRLLERGGSTRPTPTTGRANYLCKPKETRKEALRAPKRRISDAVDQRLMADTHR